MPGADNGDALRVTIPERFSGHRLDRALAALLPSVSRSQWQRLIGDGLVIVDGTVATRPSAAVAPGQAIQARLPGDDADAAPRPQDLDLEVIYEDDDVAIINKPAGLVVHAGAGRHQATLVDGLLHRFGDRLSRRGGPQRPGIVHRLDKGTSGVMVVALNDAAHDALAAQFAARTIEKEYAAVVYGCPKASAGTIELPLGRDRGDRTKVSGNTDRPRVATSGWEIAEEMPGFAHLRVFPKTGRLHQIRAHLAHIHHPCVGDAKYCGAQWKNVAGSRPRNAARDFARPALHAHRIVVAHPESGERLGFASPLPTAIEALLAILRRG